MRSFVSKKDLEVLKLFSEYVYLQSSHVEELSGRGRWVVRNALRKLGGKRALKQGERKGEEVSGFGYLKWLYLPDDLWGERVWFPTQKLWDHALQEGWIDQHVEATDEKTNKLLRHNLVLTNFHLALHRLFGAKLKWSQLHHNTYVRWGQEPDEKVYADAFFYLDLGDRYPSFYVEVENSGENKYEKGKSSRVRKMESYLEFSDGPFQEKTGADNFRVITLVPSEREANNFITKLSNDRNLATPKFWVADFESAMRPAEKVFLTPKDYQHRAYSLHDV